MTAREWLFSLEQIGIKLGLDQIRTLVRLLGHPERAFPSVVIAGTNGKGSVAAMTERGLRAGGYRTGRYTSPHLVGLEERIVIDGEAVDPAVLDGTAARVRELAAQLPAPPSFFEATTAIALQIFRDQNVDVAVLEVGLGGRLDATNVVQPLAVAITAIDFDHEQYLGHTIEAIAREKAGVIKTGTSVVLSRNPREVRDVVIDACAETGADFLLATDGVRVQSQIEDGRIHMSLDTPRAHYADVTLALRGRHQVDNAVTAVRLLEVLSDRLPRKISNDAVRTALTDVVWPARLELLAWRGRPVLIDGAHNPAGARALASYLDEVYPDRVPIVLGVMADKAVDRIVHALAAKASAFVCTSAASSRALAPEALANVVRTSAPGVPAVAIPSPIAALDHAATLGSPVIVAGSLYLAGEIRSALV